MLLVIFFRCASRFRFEPSIFSILINDNLFYFKIEQIVYLVQDWYVIMFLEKISDILFLF